MNIRTKIIQANNQQPTTLVFITSATKGNVPGMILQRKYLKLKKLK